MCSKGAYDWDCQRSQRMFMTRKNDPREELEEMELEMSARICA